MWKSGKENINDSILVVIIMFTYGNFHANSYGYLIFVSRECSIRLGLMQILNTTRQQIWCWYLSQCDTVKVQQSMYKCVDLPDPSLLPYTNNPYVDLDSDLNLAPFLPALAHIDMYKKFMPWSKSSFEH